MNKQDAAFSNRELRELMKYKKNQLALAAGLPLVSVSPEPPILGAIVGQAQLISRAWSETKAVMQSKLIEQCNWVSVKLCALRYHLERYRKLEAHRMAEINSDGFQTELIQRGVRVCELELLYEVESFFFQFKSTLDMLVKVLNPITEGKVNLHTFGDSGKRVIAEIRQLKKNKKIGLTEGRLDWLIEIIEAAGTPFLESVIRVRDTFAHYKTDLGLGFIWDSESNLLIKPQITFDDRSMDLVDGLEMLADSILRFAVDFIAISTSCALPLSISVRPLAEDERRYVGAKWKMDLKYAVWTLGSNVIREYSEQDISDAALWADENIYDY